MGEGSAYATVWGQVTGDVETELREFWVASGASGDLPSSSVVSTLRAPDGGLRGISWVQADDVPLVAGRRFWIYRSAVQGPPGEDSDALLAHTFETLERAFDRDAGGPIGLCLTVADPAEMERRPQAAWEAPPMLFAGYAPDGSQVRIAYFAGAQI